MYFLFMMIQYSSIFISYVKPFLGQYNYFVNTSNMFRFLKDSTLYFHCGGRAPIPLFVGDWTPLWIMISSVVRLNLISSSPFFPLVPVVDKRFPWLVIECFGCQNVGLFVFRTGIQHSPANPVSDGPNVQLIQTVLV